MAGAVFTVAEEELLDVVGGDVFVQQGGVQFGDEGLTTLLGEVIVVGVKLFFLFLIILSINFKTIDLPIILFKLSLELLLLLYEFLFKPL